MVGLAITSQDWPVAGKSSGQGWEGCKRSLGRVHDVVSYWELRDAATTLELALWKGRIEDGEGGGRARPSREECRVRCGADVAMRGVIGFFAFRREW